LRSGYISNISFSIGAGAGAGAGILTFLKMNRGGVGI
jgi:hypothetical protein